MKRAAAISVLWVILFFGGDRFAVAHDHTREAAEKARRAAQAKALALAQAPPADAKQEAVCRITLDLRDAKSGAPLHALLRFTDLASGKALKLRELIDRELNWHTATPNAAVVVPRGKYKVEAIHGLRTELFEQVVDATNTAALDLKIELRSFYDPRSRNLQSGNTHLHLMRLTHAEAERYLREVSQADGLDLVFLSHLRRIPDEREYISNVFTDADLGRLSQSGVLFGNGEEHRHNFGRGGEGFGHVMLLDLLKLIRPVSIGPGIMREGTDGIPLQRGIQEAHRDGATVIWCHNTFGLEDLPNWAAGLIDAQNIFDGGNHGSYEDTFYRYLNLGMRVPFSTGTDWFIYDFNRVYVPLEEELTVKSWLKALAEGKSYITNGPFLELTADGAQIGDTIALDAAGTINVQARGAGRCDFGGLELVYNGEVVATSRSERAGGHYTAQLDFKLATKEPGWLAVRIPLDAGKGEFDRPLYAHTSPIYVELGGRRIFRPNVAREMIMEMRESIDKIEDQAVFADDEERDAVLSVYRAGIEALEKRIAKEANER